MSVFRFKRFSVINERSPMKVNTDGVLLGAVATLCPADASVLDIGTGTGTIALMLAQRLEGRCSIEAIDIDQASAEEARENFEASPWSASIKAYCFDCKNFIPGHSYDLIVSNPPYFDNSLVNPDSRKASARHSDSLSYEDIVLFSNAHLSADGRLALVLPSDSEKSLLRFAKSHDLYPERIVHIRTVSRKPASRIIAEFVRQRPQQSRNEELIMMEEGHYTSQYSALLQDFYLFL